MNSAITAGAEARPSFIHDKLLMGLSLGQYLKGFLRPWSLISLAILAVGIPIIIYRFMYGIGTVSNLTDSNPWGFWIGVDVAGGVALAAGGYTLATTVYIFNLKKYKPVVRPAILTGFLGYFFVVVGLLVDLGRPWNLPMPMGISMGLTSVMFEVAWCVALYCTVLFLEFTPAAFEWLGWTRAREIALKVALALTIFGVVLSTLHQSSLGSLFLMAKGKLHPLWWSPYTPIYFFVSSIIAGLSMVIFESTLSHKAFHDQLTGEPAHDMDGIALGLGKAASIVMFSYLFIKLLGIGESQSWHHLATGWGAWYLVELLGFVALPAFLYAIAARNRLPMLTRWASVLAVLGVLLNRCNVAFGANRWYAADRYTPHWMEVVISVTVITIGILTFKFIVNRMPILREHPDFRGSEH